MATLRVAEKKILLKKNRSDVCLWWPHGFMASTAHVRKRPEVLLMISSKLWRISARFAQQLGCHFRILIRGLSALTERGYCTENVSCSFLATTSTACMIAYAYSAYFIPASKSWYLRFFSRFRITHTISQVSSMSKQQHPTPSHWVKIWSFLCFWLIQW